MRESLVIPFPSNLTWPGAEPPLPKGLPMGSSGMNQSHVFNKHRKSPWPCSLPGSQCRTDAQGNAALCSVLRHSLPMAVYRPCSGLWISLSQTPWGTKTKSGSCRKLNKMYKIDALNWKCTDNVLSTHAHFKKEITELTGNEDYSY